jgi:hypothetical protein
MSKAAERCITHWKVERQRGHNYRWSNAGGVISEVLDEDKITVGKGILKQVYALI